MNVESALFVSRPRLGRRAGCLALASVLALAATPQRVLAQAGPADSQPPAQTLGEVTVTSRRFDEPLQKIPFSVSAVTEQQMEERRIYDTRDLYRWIPNFNFTDTGIPEASLVNIRGIGSSSALIGPAVTYYIDGVPMPQRVFDIQFLDLSRVEVLRGPQGTLFGQNSQAGAVSLVTNDPGDRPQAQIGVEFGNYNMRRFQPTAGGPIGGKVAGRVAVEYYGRDGDIDNILYAGPNRMWSDAKVIREQSLGAFNGKVKVDAGDNTSITLAGYFQRDRQQPTTGAVVNASSFPRNSFNPVPQNDIDTGGGSITIVHDLGFAKLTSLTGFQAYGLGLRADITDGFLSGAVSGLSPFVFGPSNTYRQINESLTQWTEELRLDGQTSGGIRWVGGFSALYSDFGSTTDIASPALPNGNYAATQRTTNLAVFGEVTVPVVERLRAIAGLRLTHEDKLFQGFFRGRPGGPPAVPFFSEQGTVLTNFVTGRVGLDYDVTRDVSAYATIARGERSGGFPIYNQNAAIGSPSPAFRNSWTWSYEAGLRGRMLDKRLAINFAGFINDTTGEQLFTFNPLAAQFRVENASTLTYGSELELTALPVAGLTLSANLALLGTRVTQVDPGSSVAVGNAVPYAPNVTSSLAAQYLWPAEHLGLFGNLFGRVEYQYVGSRAIDPANSYTLDPYGLVNLRAGWSAERFDIYGFLQNLFDTRYAVSGFRAGANGGGQSVIGGVPGMPLTVGLGGRIRF